MRTQLTVVNGHHMQDVVVDASDDASVAEVLGSINAALGANPSGADPAAVGSGTKPDTTKPDTTKLDTTKPEPLPADSSWDTVGVLEGSVLQLDGQAALVPPARLNDGSNSAGIVQLRATGGPLSGQVYRVGSGKVSIGADPACALRLDETDIPAVAMVITVAEDGLVSITRADGEVELTLNEESVLGTRSWFSGDVVRLGKSRFELVAQDEVVASLTPSEELGRLDYNRPPRLLPPLRTTGFKLPTPPGEEQRRSLPILAALAPLALSVGAALIMQRPAYLLFGLLSPVMMIAGFYSNKKSGKLSHSDRMRKYKQAKKVIESEARAAVSAFELERQFFNPDPATAGIIATTPLPRLWERRRKDPDHLSLRLGTCTMPSDVVLEDPEQLEHKRKVSWPANGIPVRVSLPERGVLGICGDGEQVANLAAWVVGQLAVAQSPRDVQFYVLTSQDRQQTWEWLRWLPHARSEHASGPAALLGTDTASLSARVSELSATINRRIQAKENNREAVIDEPDIVVVLDGARRLRALPGIAQILAAGAAVGIYAVCLDAEERLLPEECNAVFSQSRLPGKEGSEWTLAQQREQPIQGIRRDTAPAEWFAWVGRALAPVRDASDDGDSVLPNSARLLEVLGLEPPSADALVPRWLASGRTTEAIIGVSLDGPFGIDLRKDGPHGLIAGTTGSGKSELLQTLVASLAAANRPDEMTFVLIDYKGGAAFKDCANLPHTVGMVTDLDTHLVERAMASLSAELRRREHQLSAVGAKDIEDYTVLADRDRGMPRMPRLMIVIDEFAAMKAELPDFIEGLVNIAQRGRSLGIHLILATQRPSGAVSADIRANSNLRIALRVTDAGDSSDVLNSPEAAKISPNAPGRGYVRSGAASLVPFQAARVGGRRPGVGETERQVPKASLMPWEKLGSPADGPLSQTSSTEEELTDLAVLVSAINEASTQLRMGKQHSPWLPALPTQLVLEDLPLPEASAGTIPPVAFGLEDLPALQDQRANCLDFQTFNHLYIVGSARSGRSQALRTIAGSIAASTSVNDIHLYGLDFGNGALLPVSKLPHTGAVATRLQTERVERLVEWLGEELARRQQVMSQHGFAGIVEQRANSFAGERLPHLVVLFDQWEGFMSTLGDSGAGVLVDRLINLLREGAQAGIHFVITGDKQLLNTRMSSLVESKLVLRFSDKADYSLAGLQPRKMPDNIPAGRAYAVEGIVETQIALLSDEPSGQAQAEALRSIGQRVEAAQLGSGQEIWHRPFRLEALPQSIGFDEAWATRTPNASPLWAMLGVGGDNTAAIGVDLADGAPTFLVAGPPRSGRSTALVSLACSLLRQGSELVILTPRSSPLRALAERPGVRAVLESADVAPSQLEELTANQGRPVVLVLDDAELVGEPGLKEWLRQYVRSCSATSRALLVAGHIDDFGSGFSGWQVDVRNNRNGALLAPSSTLSGALIGASLSKSMVGQNNAVMGRALLNSGSGQLLTVQVAQA